MYNQDVDHQQHTNCLLPYTTICYYNIQQFIFTYLTQLGCFCNVLVGNVQRIHRFMKYKIISQDKMFLSPRESEIRKYFKHSIQTNEETIKNNII